MSFHIAGWQGSLGNTANTDVNAVLDQVLTIQNNHLLPYADMKLIFAIAFGAQLSRARLNSPKFRQYMPLFIRPIIVAAQPGTNPNLMLLADQPPVCRALEELQLEVTNAVVGPTQTNGFVALQESYEPWPPGEPYIIRGTSSTAATALAWSDVAYTLDNNLPVGRYAMVLSEVQSTTGCMHRWIFDRQYPRPGSVSHTGIGNRSLMDFYRGALGKFGEFNSTTLPRLQVFCTAADAAHEIYAWCIPIGPIR